KIATPARGQHHIGTQRKQAGNLRGVVGSTELGEELCHYLYVRLHGLQRGREDFPAFAAPGVVLVDDRDGLEVRFHLEEIDENRQHLRCAVRLSSEIVTVLLCLEDRGGAAVPHEVHNLQVFRNRDELIAAA